MALPVIVSSELVVRERLASYFAIHVFFSVMNGQSEIQKIATLSALRCLHLPPFSAANWHLLAALRMLSLVSVLLLLSVCVCVCACLSA